MKKISLSLLCLLLFLGTGCKEQSKEEEKSQQEKPQQVKLNKAELATLKYEAVKIGKLLPSCNPFLEKPAMKMPSPKELKEMCKGKSKALDLLEKATFNFKGGEDPKSLNGSDFKLIEFKAYGFFLAGDGAARDL